MGRDHLEHFPWAAQFEGLEKLEFNIRKIEKIRLFMLKIELHREYTVKRRALGHGYSIQIFFYFSKIHFFLLVFEVWHGGY